MNTYQFKFIILIVFGAFFVQPIYPQSAARDSSFHPYRVNYWVSGTLSGVGILFNYLGTSQALGKDELSLLEIQALNKNIINGIDNWALKQDPSGMDDFEIYSDYTLMSAVVLPGFLLFDKNIRRDWFDVLLMYVETMSLSPNIYEWSFLGPTFHHRIRPVAYYDQLTYEQRKSGNNRNSMYSGHVATVAASTFFMVKVFSDYNPEIGDNKYFLYAAAAIPPLLLGYFRVKASKHFPSDVFIGFGVGALCGILVPELHRISIKDASLGVYSSFEGTGIRLSWQPDFEK